MGPFLRHSSRIFLYSGTVRRWWLTCVMSLCFSAMYASDRAWWIVMPMGFSMYRLKRFCRHHCQTPYMMFGWPIA